MQRTHIKLMCTMFFFCMLNQWIVFSSNAQSIDRELTIKMHGGLSSYLGDNNTTAFNRDVFSVSNKWPYSVGVELGYRVNNRWLLGLGTLFADYPIITRFSEDLPVESHPTRRTSFQAIANYALNAERLQPFLVIGMHVTIGQVSIFEASKLRQNRLPEVHKHYIWGPVVGAGLDYFVSPGLSLVAQLVTNVTLVDDSADGRLPLGPPLPTNLREKDRFAPFDLLSALSIGVIAHPACFNSCNREGRLKAGEQFEESRGIVRMSRSLETGLSTFSYYFSPWSAEHLYVGISSGVGPKLITAQFVYPEGLVEDDVISFTDAFAGLSINYFGTPGQHNTITFNAGIMAAMPRQAHLSAGFDYHIGESLMVGLEGRYTLCQNREQVFYKSEVVHIMNSTCDYRAGIGFTTGVKL